MTGDLVARLRAQLTLPVFAAPMLLVSGTELVIAACRAGVVGCLPTLNARSVAICEKWLIAIAAALDAGPTPAAPYALNIGVHPQRSDRTAEDVMLAVRHRVPIVITSVGHPGEVAARVHDYGGIVFHDVATMRHAEKAIAAGVDGLILLTAGAGGHTGRANPFGFVRAVRSMWAGPIALAGAISDGAGIAAAELLGADFAYMGTRFAATRESMASPAYRDLLVAQGLDDIVTTDRISGIDATFMRGSIPAAPCRPVRPPPARRREAVARHLERRAWRRRDRGQPSHGGSRPPSAG